MYSPLLNACSGQVFYQGESNYGDPLSYNCTFPALISGWREAWSAGTGGLTDPLFPFGFVQLSIHGGAVCYGSTACYNMPTWSKGYAGIRWAQTASTGTVPNAAMPNVFMATAVDIGEDRTPAGIVYGV
jgi:sialate O-acetylesterase